METAKTAGRWRQHVAPLMLELSRGWAMLDPLRVRKWELWALFTRDSSTPVSFPTGYDIIDTDPDHLFSGSLAHAGGIDLSGLPVGFAELVARLTDLTALYAVLAEDRADDQSLADSFLQRWADA